MIVKNFKKDRLQNMEHYQFASRVLQLCNEAKVGKLTAVLGPLTACVAAEDRVLNQPRTGADKQAEALRKELDPLIRKFEEANGIAPNVLTFTGKTKGTGKSKAYELAYTTDPKRTLWVVREKDELKEVKE